MSDNVIEKFEVVITRDAEYFSNPEFRQPVEQIIPYGIDGFGGANRESSHQDDATFVVNDLKVSCRFAIVRAMTVTETREVIIEASPEQILEVIADIEALPDWSSAHQSVELIEVGADGRPKLAKMKVNTAGNADEQVIAYTWSDNSVSWTLVSSSKLRTQEGRYTVMPEGERTRLKFELTVDPTIPVPGFLLKRIIKGSMQTATDGLRTHVLKVIGG